MDWVGAILFAGIFATWVLALTFGGAQWAWSDGRTIACFVVCGVLIIIFGLQQRFRVFTDIRQRIFPAGFLLSRSAMLQYFATSCTATGLGVVVYYIPIFFQFTRNDSPIKAAVRLLPFILLLVTSMMVSGALMGKTGYYKPWFIASGVLMVIGGPLMYTVDSQTSPARVYGYSILIAVGTGLTMQASYSVAPVKTAMDPKFGPAMIPDAIGWVNLAQLGSIVHALTISGTVFQNMGFRYLSHALAGRGFTDAEIHGAISGAQSQLLINSSAEVRTLAVEAIVKAMSRVYILVIVAGVLCLLASSVMRMEKLFVNPSSN